MGATLVNETESRRRLASADEVVLSIVTYVRVRSLAAAQAVSAAFIADLQRWVCSSCAATAATSAAWLASQWVLTAVGVQQVAADGLFATYVHVCYLHEGRLFQSLH